MQVRFRANKDIAIHIPDVALAARFYGESLGFPLVNRGADNLEFDMGALRLYVNQSATKALSYIPSFDVANRAMAGRHLEAAGCRAVSCGASVYFTDPFGFLFDIIERL